MTDQEAGINWSHMAIDLADELGQCSRVCPNVRGEDCTECWLVWAVQKLPYWERPRLKELRREEDDD